MAVAVQPSGLMDIASSLTQDEIPFKLRCAICNKLAVNAFRLPCCDQAICENCQTSLPDTCPVCAHTPISPDLCKPNKALRTTLKAFLRTEEKKREKERQAALPAPTNDAPPAEEAPVKQDPQPESHAVEGRPAEEITLPASGEPSLEVQADNVAPVPAETDGPGIDQETANGNTQDGEPEQGAAETADPNPDMEANGTGEGDNPENSESAQQTEQENPQNAEQSTSFPNAMGFNMNPGMFPNMWGNPMAQFMGNGMMGFPNPMGMPGMGMDPMAASQGMFGSYGMNGMNGMGMNFNAGQGLYGGWDGSQNNMWNGSQDKFNPNAFANGMGAQFGDPSGFGGYNMSQPNGVHPQMQQQQFPNQEFQNGNGYYGSGNYRGRGRGYYSGGRGRGGFGGHANFPHNTNSAGFNDGTSASMSQDVPAQSLEGATEGMDPNTAEGQSPEGAPDSANPNGPSSQDHDNKPNGDSLETVATPNGPSDQPLNEDGQQLHGIPTIDSLDQANGAHGVPGGLMGMPGHMSQGFGRGGGFMRGGYGGGRGGYGGQQFIQLRGQGVEGAPAAPRAMRQGLPNTSVFRHRNFQAPGRGSMPPGRSTEASETPHPEQAQENQDAPPTSRSISRARSRSRSRSKSRSRSPTRSRSNSRRRHRQRSATVERDTEDHDRQRDRPRRPRLDEKERPASQEDERRTRSPSIESHRSSLRGKRHRRSRRSHRRRSRSRSRSASPDRKGESREDDRLSPVPEEPDRRSGKDRSGRRIEDRERDRDSRDSRRRDRDRERERDRERDRDRDRDRDRRREREKDQDRDRDRDRYRERDRDRKRSRRDRSESAVDSDYQAKKAKRGRGDEARSITSSNKGHARETREKPPSSSSKPSEPEKDPHTLEREARNRERMLKEQQRREAMQADRDGGKSSRRRDSRQERGGRRLNYKYDDEADAARTARVEREREADRWA